jgi:hypothetical protein
MGTKVITVRIGHEPNHTDFTVHEDPIRASSKLFQVDLCRPWRESNERIVRLPVYEATAFKIYVHWLYSGLLCATPVGARSSISVSSSLVRGYLLADYLQDSNYQDNIMDSLVEWNRNAEAAECMSFLSSWIRVVDKKTCEGNPLQKLLVDVVVWKTTRDWWGSVIAEMPVKFVYSVCLGLSARNQAQRTAISPFSKVSGCSYHSHGDEPCYLAEQSR